MVDPYCTINNSMMIVAIVLAIIQFILFGFSYLIIVELVLESIYFFNYLDLKFYIEKATNY